MFWNFQTNGHRYELEFRRIIGGYVNLLRAMIQPLLTTHRRCHLQARRLPILSAIKKRKENCLMNQHKPIFVLDVR